MKPSLVRYRLVECAVDGAAASSEHFADLRDCHVFLLVESLGSAKFVGGEGRGAASGATTRALRLGRRLCVRG